MTDQKKKPRWGRRLGLGLVCAAVALGAWAWLANRPPHYDPTPENEAATAELTDGAMTFVLLHEAGHMMIKLFDLPRIAGEEDEADHFAGAVLTGAMDPEHPDAAENRRRELALFGAASYFDQMHKDDILHLRQPAWSDEHGQPEQRALNIACLLYGRSPNKWGEMARLSGLSDQRLRRCPDEAAANQTGWQKLMSEAYNKDRATSLWAESSRTAPAPNLLLHFLRPGSVAPSVLVPASRKVGVIFNPVPDDLDTTTKAMLLRGQQMAKSGHAIPQVVAVMSLAPMPWILDDHREDTYAYRLVGDPCIVNGGQPDDNAWWDASTHTITYCYRLISEIEDNSRNVVAYAAQRVQKAGRPSV